MNLRLKLLISFSLSALCALLLFGFVAYDTALDESEKNEGRLIFTILKDDLAKLAETLKTNQDVVGAVRELDEKSELVFYITGDNGKPLYSSPELNKFVRLDIDKMSNTREDLGQIEFADEHEYHWRRIQIDGSPYKIIALYHHTPDEQNSFLVQMALSLAVTAFIVIWIAAWSAIYIASLLEKLNFQKNELEKLATHDSLTGLPNRMLLLDRVGQAIQFCGREKQNFTLCFIDLNDFKIINDTLGHKYGDKVLQIVAKRLKKAVRRSDTVARLGGDELAIVLNKTDKAGAKIVAEKIMEAIEQPMEFREKIYKVSASIGIAIYPKNGQHSSVLIKHADNAMYRAKKNGLRYQFVDDVPLEDFTNSELINTDFEVSTDHPFS